MVEGRTITSIPLATRNFTQILGTSAGVVGAIMNADNRGTGSDSVSVNGARRGSNNLLVDGVPTTNQLNNAPDGDTPSIEFQGAQSPHQLYSASTAVTWARLSRDHPQRNQRIPREHLRGFCANQVHRCLLAQSSTCKSVRRRGARSSGTNVLLRRLEARQRNATAAARC